MFGQNVTMDMNRPDPQKGIADVLIIVVGLALLVALIIGLNSLLSSPVEPDGNQPAAPNVSATPTNVTQPSVTEAPSVSETHPSPSVTEADWQLHTNKEIQFSIKYPLSWTLHQDSASGLGYSFQSPDLETDQVGTVTSGAYIRVTEIPNPKNLSPEEWSAQNPSQAGTKRLATPVTIDEIAQPAVSFDVNISSWGMAHSVIIGGNERLIRFDLFSADQKEAEARQTFRTMLKTFRHEP